MNADGPENQEYRSKASLMRRVPVTLFTIDGELWLHDGRLSFATSQRRVLDVPVGELHSVARAATGGLYLWHGDRRFRFVTGDVVGGVGTMQPNSLIDLAVTLPFLADDLERDRTTRRQRDTWADLLAPLVGDPPPGLRVPAPWSTWAWYAAVVGVTLLLTAVITLIAVLS